MNNFITLEDIKQNEMIPGFKVRFVHSEFMTISYWDVKKGSKLPEHKHHHEQISQVMEGEFELKIDGISQVMQPGKVAMIKSNATHSGVALTDCKIMDIFSPVREDYKI
jgi:quercetin dioxygenase-like cupin family protein